MGKTTEEPGHPRGRHDHTAPRRLRVSIEGRQATYGTYLTEDLAADAQARWRLTHLLPADDPGQAVELPASVAVGAVRCDEWFVRWQEAKKARRSRVRVNNKR